MSFYDNSLREHADLIKKNVPEILAPATATTYKNAIRAGADAIYFGYGSFNARADAENLEDLTEIVSYCHKFGVKAYLALNIMIKNSELSEVTRIIELAEKSQIDAFIISDLALVPIIREKSKAEIHASTQLGIHNVAGAEFCKSLGINRVILSRETTKEDIKKIVESVNIDVEIFVHGAICVGFSGACLFSSMLTGNSGNRGRCLQLCRRYYGCNVNGKKVDEGYLLSPKDNCMASRTNDLLNLGVTSLKIEGRLKNQSYIEGVTEIYSGLIKGQIYYNQDVEEKLKGYFNRGDFTCGYWDGKEKNPIYKYAPNNIGVFYGKIVKSLSKNLVLIATKKEVNKNDSFKVVRGETEIGGIVATGETKVLNNGNIAYVCYAPCKTQINDTVYLTKRDYISSNPRKNKIKVAIEIVADSPISVRAFCRDVYYEYSGGIVQRAKTKPLTQQDVIEQFSKVGEDYELSFDEVLTENAFMAKSQINELRRNMIAYFESQFVQNYKRHADYEKISFETSKKITGDFVQTDSMDNIDYLLERFSNIVYAPSVYTLENCKQFYVKAKQSGKNIFISLPIYINTENEHSAKEIIRVFDGVVANNPGIFAMALELGKYVIAGWNLNVANSENYFYKKANQTVLSTELNSAEIKQFPDALIYAYGKLTLMYLNFCPRRNITGNCAKCESIKTLSFTDEKGEYEVLTKKIGTYCQHEMKNSIITNLGKLCGENPRYFDFSGMDSFEISNILEVYYSKNAVSATGFNHLHLSRGVK